MLKRWVYELQPLKDFLGLETSDQWLEHAINNLPLLLLDHAHCERKAAAAAIHLIGKYPERTELLQIMSPLAREELLHFEKVLAILQQRNIPYAPLHPAAYAARLHQEIKQKDGTERLCDQLIVGALIEARSCERFSALQPLIKDKDLAAFYAGLIKAEARHFQEYLALARLYGGNIEYRLAEFLVIEHELISSKEELFRFHSGVPS